METNDLILGSLFFIWNIDIINISFIDFVGNLKT